MSHLLHSRALAVCGLGLLLAACGGGSDTVSNHAPVAGADSATIAWNSTGVTLDVLANDTDADGDALQLFSTTQPTNGSVTITDGKIVYRPHTSYIGVDQFTYVAKDRFNGQATGTVSIAVQGQITLIGRAVGLASPVVTAQVGSQTFTTTAAADGSYSLPITATTGNQFITLTAQGSGDASGIKLRSLVGEVATFATRATNMGNQLDSGFDSVLKLGSLSTARTALATLANGGTEPTTQAALNAANVLVEGNTLMQRAATIRQIMAGTVALPAGITDTAALVSNQTAYTNLVAAQLVTRANALDADIAAVKIDASQTVPFNAEPTQSSLTVYTLRDGQQRSPMLWTLRTDGTALLDDSMPARWAVSDGLLTLTFAAPQTLSVPTGYGGFINASVTALKARRNVGSETSGVTAWQFTGVDGVGLALPPAWYASSYQSMASLLAPTAAELTSGAYAGVWTPPAANGGKFDADTLVLNANGTGSLQRTQIALTWARTDTALTLTYATGEVQTLSRLSRDADGEERWLIRLTSPGVGGAAASTTTQCDCMVVKQTAGAAFTAATAAQQWLYALPGNLVSYLHQGMALNADRSGGFFNVNLGETPRMGRPVSWQVTANGEIAMTTYRLPDNSIAGTCPPDQVCTVYVYRTWRKLAEVGNKTFVLVYSKVEGYDGGYYVTWVDSSPLWTPPV
ncbi:MAG: cadherin-like domain-containing protein [Proteobacteria bacterium]|nr:cadherin-like domain-containing protein [Pseudomonadota bacterium]